MVQASSRRLNSDMEMLQQKLAENERRRKESLSAGVSVHPEEAQILEVSHYYNYIKKYLCMLLFAVQYKLNLMNLWIVYLIR